MKTEFAPKRVLKIGNSYVLWFEAQNQYIVISESLWDILEVYFISNAEKDFLSHLQNNLKISVQQARVYYVEISEFLESLISDSEADIQTHTSPPIPKYRIDEIYCFGTSTIRISFGSAQIKALIHPQWTHASIPESMSVSSSFDMFKDGDFLYLLKDQLYVGHYLASDYHLLQGQFALELINTLYHKNESNWIATFHASTVCNDKEAVMIIGDSGNGKSTLSAVLMANGYDVLADDFTPLLAEDKQVYRFPSGISVKEGAFKILQPMFPDFENFPLYKSSSKNVSIKYIPPTTSFGQAASHLPCHKIVYVKYDGNGTSKLKEVRTEKILETLIPESWLSPLGSNALLFLEWLKDLQCYELNYADNTYAVSQFKKIFDL